MKRKVESLFKKNKSDILVDAISKLKFKDFYYTEDIEEDLKISSTMVRLHMRKNEKLRALVCYSRDSSGKMIFSSLKTKQYLIENNLAVAESGHNVKR